MTDDRATGAPPACPVSLPAQGWIESSLGWAAREFGTQRLKSDVIRPAAFIPNSYQPAPAQITALVERVRTLMSVPRERIKLELFDGAEEKKQARITGRTRAVGHYREVNGQGVVAVDLSEAADPSYLTAVIAHELCHARLIGERRISRIRRPDHERLTDLMTVFFGFGVFTANAALSYAKAGRGFAIAPQGDFDEWTLNAGRRDGYSRTGYLSEAEFGYALACYCRMRGESDPPWRRDLDLGPQRYLDEGLAYLAAIPGPDLPTAQLAEMTVGRTRVRVHFDWTRTGALGIVPRAPALAPTCPTFLSPRAPEPCSTARTT